jgi:hypothetical protein
MVGQKNEKRLAVCSNIMNVSVERVGDGGFREEQAVNILDGMQFHPTPGNR